MLLAVSFWFVLAQSPDAHPLRERADLQRAIQRLTTRPTPVADPPDSQPSSASHAASRMLAEVKRNTELVDLVDAFLEKFPEDSEKAHYESLKLRSAYLLATLRGRPLDRLRSESARLWADAATTLRSDAAYWRMRLGPARRAATDPPQTSAPATMPSANGDAPVTPEAYAAAFPAARQAVPILKTLIESACAQRDFETARHWLRILDDHHPGHVEFTRLAGRVRLGEKIGKPWGPPIHAPYDTPIVWNAVGRMPVAIVFWSPVHGPSIEMLRALRDFQAGPATGPLGVVLIAIDRDCERTHEALRTLEVDWPAPCDGRGWDSPLIDELGIRGLPTVLMLDADRVLRDCSEPGPRDQTGRVLAALTTLIARGADADQDEATAAPGGGDATKP